MNDYFEDPFDATRLLADPTAASSASPYLPWIKNESDDWMPNLFLANSNLIALPPVSEALHPSSSSSSSVSSTGSYELPQSSLSGLWSNNNNNDCSFSSSAKEESSSSPEVHEHVQPLTECVTTKSKPQGSISKRSNSRRWSNDANLRISVLEKKQRHRDLEIGRRQRMNEKFYELSQLCDAKKKDKGSVLESAKIKISEYQEQVKFILSPLADVQDSSFLYNDPVEGMQEDAEAEAVSSLSEVSSSDTDPFQFPGQIALGMAEVSPYGNIVECNDSFMRLFGVDKSSLCGSSLFSFVAPSDLCVVYSKFEEILNRPQPNFASCTITLNNPDGSFKGRCVFSSNCHKIQLLLVPCT